MFKKAFLLLTITTAAYAQSPAGRLPGTAPHGMDSSALTPAQQSQINKQAETLAQDSLKVALNIDQGQPGKVWDQASAVAKSFKRKDFVRAIYSDREKLGAPYSRKRVAVTFARSKGGEVPAGLYISVTYSTQFAKKKGVVREIVSYHLDNDRVWRVSGYSVR